MGSCVVPRMYTFNNMLNSLGGIEVTKPPNSAVNMTYINWNLFHSLKSTFPNERPFTILGTIRNYEVNVLYHRFGDDTGNCFAVVVCKLK